MAINTCSICGTTQEIEHISKHNLCLTCMYTDGLYESWLKSKSSAIFPAMLIFLNLGQSAVNAFLYIDCGGRWYSMFAFILTSLVTGGFVLQFKSFIKIRNDARNATYLLLMRGPTGKNANLLEMLRESRRGISSMVRIWAVPSHIIELSNFMTFRSEPLE